jgi:uncharacterized protein (TIGR00266 family)
MKVDITSRPAYSIAYVKLENGESVFAEAGAMVAISGGVEAGAVMSGGVMRSALRRIVAQESLLMTRFTARVFGAWVALAPRFPGDVATLELTPEHEMIVQSGSMLAHAETLEVSAAIGNLQSFALKEGATVLRARGSGTLVIAAYGGLERFDLRDGETLVVDSGHLTAWSASLGFRVGPLKGVLSSTLTGEGIVGEFTGPGVVYVQTRAEQQLRSWLLPDRGHDGR